MGSACVIAHTTDAGGVIARTTDAGAVFEAAAGAF